MARITISDVREMYERTQVAAAAVGIDTREWRLHEGTTYKLDLTRAGRPSLGIGYGNNHLGNTAREAYDALHYMARAWELVAEIGSRTLPDFVECANCGHTQQVSAE